MAQPRIVIYAPADQAGDSHRKLEQAGCALTLGKASWDTPQGNTEDELCQMVGDAVALAGTSIKGTKISRRVLDAAPDLRIIAKYTIGCDDVDFAAASEKGVMVTHCPTESNWGGVAEGTMAAILTMLKKTREKDAMVKQGGWRDPALQGTYLGQRQDGYPGLTVGIIGLGRIGSRLSELLKPWRVRLIAYDPYVHPSVFPLRGVEKVDLQTLLTTADIVTLHVYLNSETYRMIGADEIALMKPTACLVNAARGGVVDEDALYDALANDRIAGAALDVFEAEPLPSTSPLPRLGDKVLLSPHMVSSTLGAGLGPGIEWATRSMIAALKGEVPDNVFNAEVIPRWLERFGGTSAFG